MCNLYSQTSSADGIRQFTEALGLESSFPEGAPNLEPKDMAISDLPPVLRGGRSYLRILRSIARYDPAALDGSTRTVRGDRTDP